MDKDIFDKNCEFMKEERNSKLFNSDSTILWLENVKPSYFSNVLSYKTLLAFIVLFSVDKS